jgi:hypothetical protein
MHVDTVEPMTPVDNLQAVHDALEARALVTAAAYFEASSFVELEGGVAAIAETLASLAPPLVMYCEVPAIVSDLLDDTDARHVVLLDEYATAFANQPVAVALAAPVSGVLIGATFWLERWLDFDDRVDQVLKPEPVTDEQLHTWATLCAQDPEFRRAGAQRRNPAARAIIGGRPSPDVVALVEQDALDMMSETLGPEARRLHAAKVSKDAIRSQLGVPKALVDMWLADTRRP